MLITLLTLAIATLAAAPVVLPVVKLLKSRRGEDSQWAGESESESESEIESEGESESESESESDDLRRDLMALNYIPDFSLELVKPAPKTAGGEQKMVASPLVEVIWQNPSALKPKKVKLQDPVERVRHTPSAEDLLDESNVFSSVNPADPPRIIAPQPIAAPPAAAQRVRSASFSNGSEESPLVSQVGLEEGTVKTYQANAEKFKMRPVTDQGGARRSTAIPMMITTAPSAVKQDHQFEVIKTTSKPKERIFSLLESPEVIASGERVWRSVQPLYLDFAPFFSLDSLIDIDPKSDLSLSGQRPGQPVREVTSIPSGKSRLGSQRGQHREERGEQMRELLRDLNTEREGLIYKDHVLDEEEDELYSDELEWSNREDSDQEETEELPEWQSLLGISNHFLFDLKLSQRSKVSHQELTEQSLEDAIVFKITSGPVGPKLESNKREKANLRKV